MTQILGKIWNDYKDIPKIHVAFTISICKTILDPATANITIDDSIMSEVKRYLVSITKYYKV